MSSRPPKRRRTREHLTYERKKWLIREIENSSIDIVAGKYAIKIQTLYGFVKEKPRILRACEDGLGQKKKLPKKSETVRSDKSDKAGKKKIGAKMSINEPQTSHAPDENDWSKIKFSYAHSDIYLGTEIGIFFKTKVDECRKLRNETCDLGDKAGDRFTVFVCADLAGYDLKNLIVIGKYQKLPKELPVNYYYDDTAWMTSEIFEGELRKWDVKLQEENRKIVLFTEEKLVHPRGDNLKNIKLMYYTDLISEKRVSFDMVRCMKAYYRRNMMEYMKNPSFKITPKNAILELRQAWKTVSSDAVRSSFVEAGITQGDRANVYLSVINTWSQLVSPDYSLLKVYTDFDDHLMTSAEGYESEESESEYGDDRLVTVEEAFEAARTLRDYCAQGSLDEDLRDQVLDILAKVQEQMRAFRSLVPDVQLNGAQNQSEGHNMSSSEYHGQSSQQDSCRTSRDYQGSEYEEARQEQGSMGRQGTPARRHDGESQHNQQIPSGGNQSRAFQYDRHPRYYRGATSGQHQYRSDQPNQHRASTEEHGQLTSQDQGRSPSNHQHMEEDGDPPPPAIQNEGRSVQRIQYRPFDREQRPSVNQYEGRSGPNKRRPSMDDQRPSTSQDAGRSTPNQRRPSREEHCATPRQNARSAILPSQRRPNAEGMRDTGPRPAKKRKNEEAVSFQNALSNTSRPNQIAHLTPEITIQRSAVHPAQMQTNTQSTPSSSANHTPTAARASSHIRNSAPARTFVGPPRSLGNEHPPSAVITTTINFPPL